MHSEPKKNTGSLWVPWRQLDPFRLSLNWNDTWLFYLCRAISFTQVFTLKFHDLHNGIQHCGPHKVVRPHSVSGPPVWDPMYVEKQGHTHTMKPTHNLPVEREQSLAGTQGNKQHAAFIEWAPWWPCPISLYNQWRHQGEQSSSSQEEMKRLRTPTKSAIKKYKWPVNCKAFEARERGSS